MIIEHNSTVLVAYPQVDEVKFDDAAFELLFKNNFLSLCAFCQYKFEFDLDLAKEAVHTGFIKLWENREAVSSELSVKAYLKKIIYNICLDMIKHRKVEKTYADFVLHNAELSTGFNSFQSNEVKRLKDAIDTAVAELPEQMRKVFELRTYNDLKYAEIADRLNLSIKTVQTQLSRAAQKMKQKLAPYLVTSFISLFLRIIFF